MVGKRGAATGRLQIKPSGSGDENGWRAVQIETNGLASVGFLVLLYCRLLATNAPINVMPAGGGEAGHRVGI